MAQIYHLFQRTMIQNITKQYFRQQNQTVYRTKQYDYYHKQFNQSHDNIIQLSQQFVNQVYIIQKMFKSKNNKQSTPQVLTNELLSFLARQINILKDINHSLLNTDKSVSQGRLNECIHLIEKKILFQFSDNPQQYHDYIQDFYENQLGILRNQVNQLKMQTSLKSKQIQEYRVQMQLFKHKATERSEDTSMNYEQFYRLQRQLDHSKLLISENNKLLTEQNNTIKNLSEQVKSAQKENKKIRKSYEQKILSFNQFSDSSKDKFTYYFTQLQNSERISEQQIKQMSINTLKTIENSNLLNQELQIKNEEIRLLTKKIFESDMLITKLERSLVIKDKAIEQIQEEMQNVINGIEENRNKSEQYKNLAAQKQVQIKKLEQRISRVNATSTDVQRQLISKQSRIDSLERQLKQHKNNREIQANNRFKLENQLQKLHMNIREKDSIIEKQKFLSEKSNNQVEQLTTNLKEMATKNKKQKQLIKNSIMDEVNQLVVITQTQKQKIMKLQKQLEETKKTNNKLNQVNEHIQEKFNTITDSMGDITLKINKLELENKQMFEANQLLLEQNSRYKIDRQKLQAQESTIVEMKQINNNLQKQLKQYQQNFGAIQKEKIRQLQDKVVKLTEELKNSKQLNSKKDFQCKQNESRIKILQQDLRSISTLYENQKAKMNKKIRQLQQLLKDDVTSRKSSSGVLNH